MKNQIYNNLLYTTILEIITIRISERQSIVITS